MIIKKGIAVSNGIAIGKCYPVDRDKVFITGYCVSDPEGEIAKLKAAVSYTSNVLDKLQYSNIVGKINAELYEAYKLLLEDELFIGEAVSIIKNEKVNAEYALKKVRDNFLRTMSVSENEYLRERVSDIEHIYQRMQRHMSNLKYDEFEDADSSSVIVSRDLTPSDVEIMLKKGIKGFASDVGSKTSHNAIVAKSAGLVAVVGLKNIYDTISKGDVLIVDGFLGQVIINPDTSTLERYEKKRADYASFLASFNNVKDPVCKTADGEALRLFANIESNEEITLIDVHGLDGVGLYRTEFLYMNNGDVSEEGLYALYSRAVSMLKGKPLVLRSFDLGGDKKSRYMPHPKEDNPALGLRAIRYCLKYEDFFTAQLRAILRAGTEGDIRLMLPMVSGVDEFLTVKNIIKRECVSLKAKGFTHNDKIKMGIMVELPSAALSIDKFLPHADFFSVGTNDLIQYSLGVDRNNEHVSHLYSPAHHAVITILDKVFSDTRDSGKEVSVCGELAGDCRYIAMLLGLGYRSFSMNPRSSYIIRKVAGKLRINECEKLVRDLREAPTIKEAENMVTRFNNEKVNNIIM